MQNFISGQFIRAWHPKYDDTEHDEPEYEEILTTVHSELEATGSLTERTFNRILKWKKTIRNKWRMCDFQTYCNALRKCREISDNEKMGWLVELPGIGAPVASTFLHFMYPSLFPIMDKRTVDVLKYYGYVQRKSTDVKQYPAFMGAVLSIKSLYPKWSLREIDRAIFAYHKQNPELFGQLTRTSCSQN